MVKMKNTIQLIFMVLLSLENPGVVFLAPYENPFCDILQDHCRTYIDKTDLLEVILGSDFDKEILLITMPKRFGKTTNLGMIQKFCEIEMFHNGTPVAKDLNNIIDTPNYNFFTRNYSFGHLKITQNEEFVRKNLGKHPVAFFNFKECGKIVMVNMKLAINCIAYTIRDAFFSHQYLLNEKVKVGEEFKLSDYDKSEIESWIKDYRSISMVDVTRGIQLLLRLLYTFHGKKVVLLVDEYDALAHSVIKQTLPEKKLKDILEVYYSIFYKALKNEATYRVAVFTGIIHISDEGFSNMLTDVQMFLFARNQKFVKYYGFTSNEIEELFKRPENEIKNISFEEMKNYYDGYKAFGEDIYAPFSIIKCLEKKKIDSYWVEAGSIEYIWPALQLFRLRIIVLDLCEKKSVVMTNLKKICLQSIISIQNCINTKIIEYGESEEIDAFLNLLLDAGYFKIISSNNTHFHVSLANEETSSDLKALLKKHKSITNKDKRSYLESKIMTLLTSFSYDTFETRIQLITDLWTELAKIYLPNRPNYKEEDLKNMFRLICFGSNVEYFSEAKVNKTEYIIPTPPSTTFARKIYNPDIPILPQKPSTTITTLSKNPKDEDGNKTFGYVDFIITQIPEMLIIAEMKYSTYGTSKTALQQIQTQYLGGVFESKYYQKQDPPRNILLLGVHVPRNDVKPSITVSATVIALINSNEYGDVKTIHCTPMGPSSSVTEAIVRDDN